MAKLSDAGRLARLFRVLEHLATVEQATVGELAARFGGSPRALYEDLLAAWLAEDPKHTGMFPFHLYLEYFEEDDPEPRPLRARRVWLCPEPRSPGPLAVLKLAEARDTVRR